MYTLLNVIKFGLKEPLNNNDKLYRSSEQKIDEILRLDFLSGIYFRVFENLISDENDPARFKLDIRVNNGSILNPEKMNEIEDHCIPIVLANNSYRETLTLEDIHSFFNTLLGIQEIPEKESV